MPKKKVPDYVKQHLIGDSRRWYRERWVNDYTVPVQPEGLCLGCGGEIDQPLGGVYCSDCRDPSEALEEELGLFDDPDRIALAEEHDVPRCRRCGEPFDQEARAAWCQVCQAETGRNYIVRD